MKRIIAITLVFMIMTVFCSCVQTDNNIENYTEDVEEYHAGLFMPDLADIGEYKSVEYFVRKETTLFPEYSMQLIVKYDEETFLKEKERLERAYTYLDAPQLDGDVYTIPIEAFSVSGFDFRIALFEDTTYPKNFGMVGVSNDEFEIAYLWIYAPDLDYICETNENEIKAMTEFIEYFFSFE